MGYIIDDPRAWRVSKSGFSIKTGWATDAKIIAKAPTLGPVTDAKAFQEWLDNAERICELYNATLPPAPPNENVIEPRCPKCGWRHHVGNPCAITAVGREDKTP